MPIISAKKLVAPYINVDHLMLTYTDRKGDKTELTDITTIRSTWSQY